MSGPRVAVDAQCLECHQAIIRTEADPGDTITIPDHECPGGAA